MTEYVGFDVSKEETVFCAKDAEGKILARGKVVTDPRALFEALKEHCLCPGRIVMETYGAEQVHHELAENGIEVGRHRVARLMRGNGLSPKRKQKFKKTTHSQHNKAVASNLLSYRRILTGR